MRALGFIGLRIPLMLSAVTGDRDSSVSRAVNNPLIIIKKQLSIGKSLFFLWS